MAYAALVQDEGYSGEQIFYCYLIQLYRGLTSVFQLAESETRIRAFDAELNALLQAQVIKFHLHFTVVWVCVSERRQWFHTLISVHILCIFAKKARNIA